MIGTKVFKMRIFEKDTYGKNGLCLASGYYRDYRLALEIINNYEFLKELAINREGEKILFNGFIESLNKINVGETRIYNDFTFPGYKSKYNIEIVVSEDRKMNKAMNSVRNYLGNHLILNRLA